MFGLLNPISMAQRVALAVLAVAFLAMVTFFQIKVHLLKNEVESLTEKTVQQANTIAQLQSVKKSLEEANQAWASSVEAQNAKILALQTSKKSQETKYKQELQKVQREVQQHQSAAVKWKKMALSSSSATEKEVDRQFTDYLKERQQ